MQVRVPKKKKLHRKGKNSAEKELERTAEGFSPPLWTDQCMNERKLPKAEEGTTGKKQTTTTDAYSRAAR